MAAIDSKTRPIPEDEVARKPPDATPRATPLPILRIAGGALLLASAAIHFLLASAGDQAELLRLSFLVLGLVATALTVGVLRFGTRRTLVASVSFLAITFAAQLAASIAGTGYQERLRAPYGDVSLYLHLAGLALLALAAGLDLRSKGPRTKRLVAPVAVPPAPSDVPVIEPASLAPAPDPRTAQRIRWPAERPYPVGATTASAPAPAPRKLTLDPPVRWRPRGEAAMAQAVADATIAAPAQQEIASAPPAPAKSDVAETSVASPAVSAGDAIESPAAEPTPPVRKAEEPDSPAPETVAATGEPAPESLPEPAAAATAEPATESLAEPDAAEQEGPEEAEPSSEPEATNIALEPIPMSIREPYYSMLVREQQVLHRLLDHLGPDDPRTLTNRSVIAYYYISAGDYIRGAQVQEAVAADTARILGKDHPHTLSARGKYAQWRKLAKRQRRSKAPVPG